ncbi:MAG: Hpt domain-containing protein [Spirochaetales bacterium]|nr:Hpt domain-containing protein [Spirochaetales bacterium]
MAEEKLYNTFEQDTRSFIHQINEQLIRLENSGYNNDVINQMFRCIHSIKSEAAYLKLDEIAGSAHAMESALQPLRNPDGKAALEPGLLALCFSTIDKISEQMENIRLPQMEPAESEFAPVPEDGLSATLEEGFQAVHSGFYNDFELLLVKEARSRGERLYRLSFAISQEESMKYPRAYLALSNLEMNHNVINVYPELDEISSGKTDRTSVVLSSAAGEKLIADEVNIDHIENIKISELSYDEELRNQPMENEGRREHSVKTHQRIINVEASEIDAISEYVTEIKNRLANLSSVVNDDAAKGRLELDLQGLETISSGIEKMMINLRTVDFNKHFEGYRRTARDLAAKLGKKIELEFDQQNIKVLRDFADFIAEPLLQLIRNAVVHGVEAPETRTTAGKAETGLIRIKAGRDDRALTISVSDDGGGLDLGLEKDGDLLEIITAPGFSTHDGSAEYAGRGVGLDLVKNRILKRNGKLVLYNNPGEGCEFKMLFDEGKSEVPFLVIRNGEAACAVRNADEEPVFNVKVSDMREKDGNFYINDELLFTVDGRLTDPGEKTVFQALRLSHLGKTGILLFDESLFEVHYSEDSITEGFDVNGYCRELIVNGRTADYTLLSHQVLFD